MAVAFVQEFDVDPSGDRSTTNYDHVLERVDLVANPPDGLVFHTAGFDEDGGVFRIFDVWESRQAGEQWMEAVLNPVLEQAMSGASDPASFTPPTADYWYELHHSIS